MIYQVLPDKYAVISRLLPTPARVNVLTGNGDNKQLQKLIISKAQEAAKQCQDIAPMFRTGDAKGDGAIVWAWIKHNIAFIVEPDAVQSVKMPKGLIIAGHGDCKSFAVLVAGILLANGYQVALNFCYRPGHDQPSHVFAAYGVFDQKPANNWMIISDPTISEFDKVPEGFEKIQSFVIVPQKSKLAL